MIDPIIMLLIVTNHEDQCKTTAGLESHVSMINEYMGLLNTDRGRERL